MPNIYSILFELIIYLQFVLCLRHAIKQDTAHVLKLITGILFGVLLEMATIQQLHIYKYDRFLVMIADVPLCVGVAWSCIIYSAMEFSDGSSLPYWTRPVLDGLLALNIDLALDAVAIRLGFWDWGQGLRYQYFGVPFQNFWAWFWVIFTFSLGYRLIAHRKDWIGTWISAPFALLTGLAGVLSTNALVGFVITYANRGVVVIFVLSMALALIILLQPQFHQKPVDEIAFWTPFIFHAYLLLAGLVSGVIFQPPFLLVISMVMFGLALVLHRPSIQNVLSSFKSSG